MLRHVHQALGFEYTRPDERFVFHVGVPDEAGMEKVEPFAVGRIRHLAAIPAIASSAC
jgi:hypothetical protein